MKGVGGPLHPSADGQPAIGEEWIWIGLVFVVVVSGVILFDCLGCASFFGDEAIYALVSRDGAETGEWLPLRIGKTLYLHKPPLKILLVTALFSIFGATEFVARAPDVVFGVLAISLAYLFTARRYGVDSGLLASGLIIGSRSYILGHGVRDSTQDSLITLLAVVLGWVWIELQSRNSLHRGLWWRSVAVVVAANLCKHMMGFVMAMTLVGIEVLESIWTRARTHTLVPALKLIGVAIVAGLVYFEIMFLVSDGLFAREIFNDLVVRSTSGLDPLHLAGPTYYPERLVDDFGWWLLLLVPALFSTVYEFRAGGAKEIRFLFGWVVLFLCGLSLAASKLPWYIYPIYPAISVLMAVGAFRCSTVLKWRAPRAVFAIAIFLAIFVRVDGVRRAVAEDVGVIDSHRLANRLCSVEGAKLIVDLHSLKPQGPIRSWNRYYFGSVPEVQWLGRGYGTYQSEPGDCLFVACGDPRSYPPTQARPWQTIMKIHRNGPLSAPIWVVGTCDLDVSGSSDVDQISWDHLILAGGFEDGGFGGFSWGDKVEEP